MTRMVELARARPRHEQKFFLANVNQGTLLVIGEDFVEVLERDVAALVSARLIEGRIRDMLSGASDLYITRAGYDYYQRMRALEGEPAARVEGEVRKLLDDERFRDDYPQAYARWAEAEQLLWAEDSERNLSTIGHKAREAVQEFTTALVARFSPPNVDTNVGRVKNRLRSVIDLRRQVVGTTRFGLLVALLDYWSNSVDLVQRQEHSGEPGVETVTWDDARRVVLHTAVLMSDIAEAMRE